MTGADAGVVRRLPTTALGVERVLALMTVGIRLGTLAQMVPSLLPGLGMSQRPVLYGVCFGAAVTMSVVASGLAIRGRRLPPVFHAVDATVTVVLLVIGGLCVQPDQRIGPWVAFQPGYALSVVLSIALAAGRTTVVLTTVFVCIGDVIFRGPAISSETVSTVIGNLISYVILAAVLFWGGNYLRRVAADGDAARAAAVAAARREEEQRAQLAFHNGAAIVRLLADPDISDEVRDALRVEAQREARRMRSYLQGRDVPTAETAAADGGLIAQVAATLAKFSDLPISASLDLASGVSLDPAAADAVDHALAALLSNVRDHAGAQHVVVHADAEPHAEGSAWTLTVHDDGRGFDASTARFGVGLREVVLRQLASHGIDVTIRSAAGSGTTVLITGVSADRGVAT